MPGDSPLIVALYGGPGAGKSTLSARLFAALKMDHVNAELVPEVAKNLTWEGRGHALGHQPYIHAKQVYAYDRLTGKVDVIITDTSPLLSLYYGQRVTPAFRDYVLDDWRSRATLDVYVHRDPNKPYQPHGRRQSEESAKHADHGVLDLVNDLGVPVWHYQNNSYFQPLLNAIARRLNERT